MTRADITHIVATSDKQRFAISADKTRIRANQGHSFAVDLDLVASVPPAVLFHGTAVKNIAAIRRNGLTRQNRQHVHLSADRDTARKVGERHGSPEILTIAAARMQAEGLVFFRSQNGVWLTEAVPPRFIDG